jgi:protein TonB
MKIFFLIIIFLGSIVSAQAQSEKLADMTNEKVLFRYEQAPVFPGGEKAMMKFIKQNLKPICTTGKVYVTFVVDTSGLIKDLKLLRGLSAPCDSEAVRVINLFPAWKPAKQNGRNVKFLYNFIINFGKN